MFNERANSGTECSGAFDGERDEFDFSGLEVLLYRGGDSKPLKLLAAFALVSAAGLYAGDVFTLASNRRLDVFSEVGLGVCRDDIDCALCEPFVSRPAVDVHISGFPRAGDKTALLHADLVALQILKSSWSSVLWYFIF